jgi:hypothetical protein
MRRIVLAVVGVIALAGCGSGSGPQTPIVGAARTFHLADFRPVAPAAAGKPQTLSFKIDLPAGAPLVHFKHGPGPHTGIHLIIVRSDLGGAVIHQHPPVGSDGTLTTRVTFPTPGRYRAVIDVYPALSGPLRNFQLFRWLRVPGRYTPKPLPAFRRAVTVDGYRFSLGSVPHLRAVEAAFLTFTVTDPSGRPVTFTPWYGALAHAIFFRAGSLDYFHTHVCAAGATGCTSVLGPTRVTGSSTRPGQLRVGVLVPVAGTWRLFLQCRVGSKVLTAPFTLTVR